MHVGQKDESRTFKIPDKIPDNKLLELYLSSEKQRPVEVPPLGRCTIPTNTKVAFDLNALHFIDTLNRVAEKHGLIVIGSNIHDIDPRDEDEIMVTLYNTNPTTSIVISDGDAIAIIVKVSGRLLGGAFC